MSDRVTSEELHGAARIIQEHGPEAALAFEIVMQWFEERLLTLGHEQRAGYAYRDGIIDEQRRIVEQLRTENLNLQLQNGMLEDRARRSVEVYRDL